MRSPTGLSPGTVGDNDIMSFATSGERVLVVEDEHEMGRLLARGLASEGYTVELVSTGVDALILAAKMTFSVTVLDIMLPGMSGFEVCRRLRQNQPFMPILLLTARDAVDDRVRGLDAGADDYLVKPFEFAELNARIRAIRRREYMVPVQVLEVGNTRIDNHQHHVIVDGRTLSLSPKEFLLLRLLAENLDVAVSRERILTEIWGSIEHTDANVVDQYVSYLRRKLDPVATGITLATVRGVGYRLTAARP